MTNIQDLSSMIGRAAVDSNGEKVGKVGQVYLDDQTQQPLWVTIHTGLLGSKESFAPLHGSSSNGDQLVLAVSKDKIKGAPSVEDDGHLDDDENDALYTYYSGHLGTGQSAGHDAPPRGNTGREDLAGKAGVVGRDTSGPTTDDAMTRSEERLKVGKQEVVSGRARLRKYVVTENVTTTVPLSHEEVRLEREPITDANRAAAMTGQPITEAEYDVVLHGEQAVVTTETVPVERVRLATETVTEDETVTAQVRKEQIDQVEIVTDGTTNTGKNATKR